MKKLFLSTIVLLLFTISILLFQISCKKEATAQSSTYPLLPATTSKLGGVIPDGTTITVDANGKISAVSNNLTTGSQSQQGKIIFTKDTYGGGSQNYDSAEIWTANYDGSNQQKVNLALPTGYVVVLDQCVKLSPDGKTMFFTAFSPGPNYPTTSGAWSVYSSNIDGSNVHLIIQGTSSRPAQPQVVF
jgi:hypothetical protein